MRRLLAAGLLPERAGQPVKALVHVSLADLMLIDGSSALMDEWIAGVRAQWAAARAAASQSGSDGGAWLDGDGARSFTCDASVTPVVTGEVNPAALQDLIRLCAELDKRRRADDPTGDTGDTSGPDTRAEEALEQAIIGKAVDLLSGPGGLASFLRRRQLGARLGGPSLPLDVACPPTSRQRSGGLSSCGISTAASPAAVTSPRPAARSTTCGTARTAGRPASRTAPCSVSSTTRSLSTSGAGPSS